MTLQPYNFVTWGVPLLTRFSNHNDLDPLFSPFLPFALIEPTLLPCPCPLSLCSRVLLLFGADLLPVLSFCVWVSNLVDTVVLVTP